MELLVKEIFEYLFYAFLSLLTLGGLYVIKRYDIMSKLNEKMAIVEIGVRFIEQAFSHLGGHEKYQEALKWITAELGKRGIKYTEEELKGFIESSLIKMKNEFKKQL